MRRLMSKLWSVEISLYKSRYLTLLKDWKKEAYDASCDGYLAPLNGLID